MKVKPQKTKGRMIIVSGPSGSGKTTLYKKLLLSRRLKGKLVKSVSVTTRPRRREERHGRDYLFISKKQFLSRRRNGYFLEWQKVFDNYYGTPKRSVLKLLQGGKNVLLCIDVKGARAVYRRYPDALRIFIKTPSLPILKKRLQQRASETKTAIHLRLRIARQELREARHYHHVVINDQLSKAFKKLESVVYREIKTKRRK